MVSLRGVREKSVKRFKRCRIFLSFTVSSDLQKSIVP